MGVWDAPTSRVEMPRRLVVPRAPVQLADLSGWSLPSPVASVRSSYP